VPGVGNHARRILGYWERRGNGWPGFDPVTSSM